MLGTRRTFDENTLTENEGVSAMNTRTNKQVNQESNLPVPEIRISGCGTMLVYECSAALLIAAGLLHPDMVPAVRAGACRHRPGEYKVSRLGDGRVRLVITDKAAARCDRGFRGFMEQIYSG